ncbi:MAG: ABC transporter ATP-binding protein [Anaerolineae bacterium]|nr:MAG: ABC transporter ATP-binding protein [Anaerolineae bacterium]
MSLISASRLAKSFGPVDLFYGINLQVPPHARVAIVGPNGIGKTTLLRILIGEEPASEGTVQRARGTRIGYLPQEASFESGHTLWEECLQAFDEVRRLESELELLNQQLRAAPDDAALLERYGALQHRFEHLGGYTYETDIRRVLSGLGFSQREFTMPLTQLSGGQRTRALLARLLLSKPDLLVLDEPTNHLDIAAVEWLENHLAQWEGAVLLVSHDRYFIDRVCNTIWEMRPGGLEIYRGNYSAYLQQREQRWALRRERIQAEKERLQKEIEYIRRNIAGQNVSQARGKLRRVSRIIEAIEQIGFEAVLDQNWAQVSTQVHISTSLMSVDEAQRRLNRLGSPNEQTEPFRIHLRARQRSGNLVLRTENLLVGYPGNPLFRVPDLELRRLECAAVIGPNGAGKSTFLKTILGELPPLEGQVRLGASLQIGYFAQAHERLHPEDTLIQAIERVAPHMLPAEIRSYLGRYHFRGDDAFKTVSMLSGGERGRLALAQLALSGANLLLLDEPSNHLDIPSQEILQTVLADYQGTILLVSHDRYLIDALATQVWEVHPQSGRLHIFEGNYRAFQESRTNAPQEVTAPSKATSAEAYRRQQRARNRTKAEARRRAQALARLEEEIASLEAQLNELSAHLQTPPTDPQELRRLSETYNHTQQTLEERYAAWEELAAEEA